MNAAQKPTDLPSPASVAAHTPIQNPSALPEPDPASSLSALADGEAQDEEIERLLSEYVVESEIHAIWHSYQVIGDVLRVSAPAVARQAPQAFLAGIRGQLQAEAPRVQLAPAASVLTQAPILVTGHVRAPAANDAVFRWKMVAGLASLATVMAVSWTVLGTAPTGAGGSSGVGAQMALTGVNTGVAASQTQEPSAVVVNTAQGPLIRDAQLEALLAEHRQYGGMSALQMPAGFLRNATYDATGR